MVHNSPPVLWSRRRLPDGAWGPWGIRNQARSALAVAQADNKPHIHRRVLKGLQAGWAAFEPESEFVIAAKRPADAPSIGREAA